MPATTIFQFCAMEAMISPKRGWCLRARNSSVSCSERRMMKMAGTIRQPMKKGMRQPQSLICAGASDWLTR